GVAVGDLIEFLDEDRTTAAQVINHEAVVDHFMTHVDRRAERLDRALDDLDGAIDTGTETAGVGEDDGHGAQCTAPAGNRAGTRRVAGGDACGRQARAAPGQQPPAPGPRPDPGAGRTPAPTARPVVDRAHSALPAPLSALSPPPHPCPGTVRTGRCRSRRPPPRSLRC